MIRFSDRLWIAWRVLRGSLHSYTASTDSTIIRMDFTPKDRTEFGRRVHPQGQGQPINRKGS